jgi:hypothetical protein
MHKIVGITFLFFIQLISCVKSSNESTPANTTSQTSVEIPHSKIAGTWIEGGAVGREYEIIYFSDSGSFHIFSTRVNPGQHVQDVYGNWYYDEKLQFAHSKT